MIVTDPQVAIAALAAGNLCAIPTETVYGLGADASNLGAVAQVFEAKGRPINHPLIVHVASLTEARKWISELPAWAEELAKQCWPGPLTLVGPRTTLATNNITGGQDTVAVRVPNHSLTLTVLEQLAAKGVHGVVAPSANKFGHVSPTTAQHVADDLGTYLDVHDGIILDGGASNVGVESTIVLATGEAPVVLRPGGITRKMITEITGLPVSETIENAPRVSGALSSHYSPSARVHLVEQSVLASVTTGGLIAFREVATPEGLTRLSEPRSVDDFAATLYASLRKADELGLSDIYVVEPTDEGLAEAIRDRLSRAAF